MKKNMILLFVIAIILGALSYFLLGNVTMNNPKITLTSRSFTAGSAIPNQYTCDGKNISPQFSWSSMNTDEIQSYVLIVDDPDAKSVVGKTYVHWIVLLSATTIALPEGISGNGSSSLATIDPEAKECINDFGNHYYGGPCPPHGTHTYQCTLFAMSEPLKNMNTDFFTKPFTADAFRNHMNQSIIAETSLVGTYTRMQQQ